MTEKDKIVLAHVHHFALHVADIAFKMEQATQVVKSFINVLPKTKQLQ